MRTVFLSALMTIILWSTSGLKTAYSQEQRGMFEKTKRSETDKKYEKQDHTNVHKQPYNKNREREDVNREQKPDKEKSNVRRDYRNRDSKIKKDEKVVPGNIESRDQAHGRPIKSKEMKKKESEEEIW